MSERLLERYKDEMTIVIQHQYWNLRITDEHFEIELSFDNIPEKLSIPFAAIKGFFDPSVQFGLQFETEVANADTAQDKEPVAEAAIEQDTAPVKAKKSSKPKKKSSTSDKDAPDASNDDSTVVSLDAFRKK